MDSFSRLNTTNTSIKFKMLLKCMYCNSRCNTYTDIKFGLNGTPDKDKWKYCSKCEYYRRTEDIVCRCCGTRYRFKFKRKMSRSDRYKLNRERELNYSRKYYQENRETVIKRVLDNYNQKRDGYLEQFKDYYKRKKYNPELVNSS